MIFIPVAIIEPKTNNQRPKTVACPLLKVFSLWYDVHNILVNQTKTNSQRPVPKKDFHKTG